MTDQGRVLAGRYRLDEVLGSGATSTVWRARDLELGHEVAVKLLGGTSGSGGASGGAGSVAARLDREAQLLERLDHPNLVPVLGAGVDGDTPFLVMELVDGLSLRRLLEQGPFREGEAVGIVADVASGLAAAHAAGIVHRDVTPANILLGRGGVPRLVDFGIARAGDLTSMTQTNAVLGTAAYLAPEQARGELVTPASDVYALGCVLMELLTGRPPYEADSALALAYRHVHDDPPSLRDRDPEAPLPLVNLVAHCLAKEPTARYASAAELEDDLRRLQRREPIVGPASIASLASHASDATVAIAPVVAAAAVVDGTRVLPAVAAAATPSSSASALVARRSRLPVAIGAGTVAAALLVLAVLAGAGEDDPAEADTTTPTSTTTTTFVTTTTAAPVVIPVEESKGKGGGKRGGKDDDD